MRKSTLLCISLAIFCGGLLFTTSQKVTSGQTRLVALEKNLRREEESIRVLQAEWSYLNRPDRLEQLAREHLELTPLQGRQFARLSDIPTRSNTPIPQEASDAYQAPLPPAKKPVAQKTLPAKAVTRPSPPSPVTQAHTESHFKDLMQRLEVE